MSDGPGLRELRDALTRMDMFAESEPRCCLWCRHCGAVVTGGLWGYVCLLPVHMRDLTKRIKGVVTPFPLHTENRRTGVQCVNADERHECFEPTRLTDKRIRLLDAMGYVEEGWDA